LIAGHYTVRVLTGRDESRPYDRVLTGRDESRPYDRYYSVCVIRHYDKCIRHNLLISRWYRLPTSLHQYAVINSISSSHPQYRQTNIAVAMRISL
jgi:hypothetical protein